MKITTHTQPEGIVVAVISETELTPLQTFLCTTKTEIEEAIKRAKEFIEIKNYENAPENYSKYYGEIRTPLDKKTLLDLEKVAKELNI